MCKNYLCYFHHFLSSCAERFATSVNASQTMVVQNVNMVSHRNSISFRGNVDPKIQ